MQLLTSNKPPSFWRQGLLILLPALLLAAVGLYVLRRDRLLVDHEAAEQARQLASVLIEKDIPSVLAVQPSGRSPASLSAPEDDPILILAGNVDNPVVGFVVDLKLELIWPPPIAAQFTMRPMELSLLDGVQLEAWNSFQSSIWGSQNPAHPWATEPELQRLVALNLPEPYLALARYQAAVRLLRHQEWNQARDLFELIRARHASVNSESGLSLKTLSEWHLLRGFDFTPDKAPLNSDWLDGFLSGLVKQPSLMAHQLQNQVVESLETKRYPNAAARARCLGTIESWQRVLQAHDQSRALHRALLTPGGLQDNQAAFLSTNFWFAWQGQSWLVTRRVEGDRTWFLARSAQSVGQKVKLALERRSIPAYFGIEILVSDKQVYPELDSVTKAIVPGQTIADISKAGIMARISLANAKAFYAHQRVRMLWFGGVILVSLGAVVAGLLAAWRAFGQQRQLSDLKTNFVSSVSHELRTPIASVRMMAEELNDMAAPDLLKCRQYHGFMAQECRRLTALIENVLDFARMEQGRKTYDFEPTDLSKLVAAVSKTWTHYATGKSVRFSTFLPPIPIEIEADGQALQQVLSNLLDNAVKYSHRGAVVELGLEPGVGEAGEQPGARIWVKDQGPGIPPEEQTRIFDRFYRCGSELRRETQGAGLGLAIARGIVEAHHGQIKVISTPVSGSRFIVELPLKQDIWNKRNDHER